MDILRTVVFIDGRNLKYNLGAFRFHGVGAPLPAREYRLDEKHFRWREFFLGICRRFDIATGWTHRLIRVYWYTAATMRPFKPDTYLAQKIVTKYVQIFSELDTTMVIQMAKDWYDKERAYFDQTREKVFETLQRSVDFLEFKYVGDYVVKPFEPYRLERLPEGSLLYLGTREGEKGVDVGIAVDMVAKMPDYDAAVLVSGDADFLPVVRYIKDHLRIVYQFSLARGVPPRITYLSPWLRGCVDVFQSYDEAELLGTYLDRRTIPNQVLAAIDQRISDLRNTTL